MEKSSYFFGGFIDLVLFGMNIINVKPGFHMDFFS